MARSDSSVIHRKIRYQPLPSQTKFHGSQARFKGFSGPVGSGKSQALCQEAVKLSYINAGRQGLIGAPTYPMLKDATLTSFLEILESNSIPYELNKSEMVLRMKDTNSRILFRSVDHFEHLRGTNLAWFGLDELTYSCEEVWLRLESRLRDPKSSRLCGFAVWTPKGFDWVYKRFIREPVEGYEVVLASAYENRYLLDQVPDFYERLKRSYDSQFFEQEVLGQYLNINSGTVYRSFDRARNLRSTKIDPARPLLWTLDFNVDPMSSLVAQRIGDEMQVHDEISLSRASTLEACEEFRARFPKHRAGVCVYGDATGARQQTAGTNDYRIVREYLANAGYGQVTFRVPSSNPFVRDRVQLTNSKLLSAAGEVQLFIDPRCKELIADLEQVVYKPDSVLIDKDRDPKRTHLSDALGYLLWQEFRPGPKVGEQGNRLFW